MNDCVLACDSTTQTTRNHKVRASNNIPHQQLHVLFLMLVLSTDAIQVPFDINNIPKTCQRLYTLTTHCDSRVPLYNLSDMKNAISYTHLKRHQAPHKYTTHNRGPYNPTTSFVYFICTPLSSQVVSCELPFSE